MAGRGGYQRPNKPAAVSGPGKLSRRTDGKTQPIRSEKVSDRSDMQYGDRKAIESAQSAAPLGNPGGGGTPRQTTNPSVAGQARAASPELPDFIFDRPSNRPDEPQTAGLDMGPGPGSEVLANPPVADDPRVNVLQYLVTNFANKDAAEMLNEMTSAPEVL